MRYDAMFTLTIFLCVKKLKFYVKNQGAVGNCNQCEGMQLPSYVAVKPLSYAIDRRLDK
jgi:hypothetical protein